MQSRLTRHFLLRAWSRRDKTWTRVVAFLACHCFLRRCTTITAVVAQSEIATMDDPPSISNEPAPAVAKVKRTYGRKKDASAIPDEAPASTTFTRNSPSLHEKTGDATSDCGDAQDSSSSPARKDDFGWRAKMKDIDKLFADDDDMAKSPSKALAKATPVIDTPATEDDSFTTANSSIFDVAHLRASSPATPESSPMPQKLKRKAKPMAGLTSDDDALSPSASPKATTSTSHIRRRTLGSKSASSSNEEDEAVPSVVLTRASESPITEKADVQEPGPSKQTKKRVAKPTDKVAKIKVCCKCYRKINC